MNIKGFDKDLTCRGYQFEVGKTYKTGTKDNELELCSGTVFHYCDSLQKAHRFYQVRDNNRFCEVKVLGAEVTDGSKCGSNKIKIVREIVGEELDVLAGRINGNTGLFNSGDMNSGNMNSGYRNSGNMNSGDVNSGNRNSGYRNSGNMNSGDVNSGNRNSGNRNSGYRNSGNMNSGNMNSGNMNSGYRNSGNMNSGNMNSGNMNSGNMNSGYRNSGNMNSGDFNSCNNSNGVFCTQEPKINIFNMPTDMTLTQFRNSEYMNALQSASFNLTEWKNDELITHDYKETCLKWWCKLTDSNKKIIQSMPNFDPKIFFEITGIRLSSIN